MSSSNDIQEIEVNTHTTTNNVHFRPFPFFLSQLINCSRIIFAKQKKSRSSSLITSDEKKLLVPKWQTCFERSVNFRNIIIGTFFFDYILEIIFSSVSAKIKQQRWRNCVCCRKTPKRGKMVVKQKGTQTRRLPKSIEKFNHMGKVAGRNNCGY